MMFVLDNSVSMRWILPDVVGENQAYAKSVLTALRRDAARVPSLWCLETANVLARAERVGHISAPDTARFLELLAGLRFEQNSSEPLATLRQALGIARQHGLTAYDAAYLDLAMREGLPLATLDGGLRRAAANAGVPLYSPPSDSPHTPALV
jgi:predicted nucleic acid-binding protein